MMMQLYEKIKKIHEDNDIQYERYSLLSLALLFLLLDKKYYNDYIFVSFVSFFSSFVVFSNFPYIIVWHNAKPIYYEDLYLDAERLPELPLDDSQKSMYLKTYTRALICSCSILVSVLTCYWKFKTEGRSAVEVAGITGGLLQMASILNSLCGRCILYGIRTFISTKVCDFEMDNKIMDVSTQCDDDIVNENGIENV